VRNFSFAPRKGRKIRVGSLDEHENTLPLELLVGPADEGRRLDRFVTERAGRYSRSWWQRQIRSGRVLVNGSPVKSGYALEVGDRVYLEPQGPAPAAATPVGIPLEVIYEDEDVVVVSKPKDLSVHPPGPSRAPTLAGALLARYGKLATAGGPLRPGIVHRLDRDTTGVIIAAKNDAAHAWLAAQFAARSVVKTYLAVVLGKVPFDEDVISAPIRRNRRHREMMTVGHEGRQAETRYRVIERFESFTLMEVQPKTGRTHQIRVHLQMIGHPIAADRQYGRGPIRAHEITGTGDEVVLARQALHALRLEIELPGGRGRRTFEAPWPEDIKRFVELLRLHKRGKG